MHERLDHVTLVRCVQFVVIWVQNVKKTHYEIVLSTLLPHPPDFAKVGGHWERLSGKVEHMKAGERGSLYLCVLVVYITEVFKRYILHFTYIKSYLYHYSNANMFLSLIFNDIECGVINYYKHFVI